MRAPAVAHAAVRCIGNGNAAQGSRMPAAWLASYPLFNDALRHGQTTLRAAPEHVRGAVLQRVSRLDAEAGDMAVRLRDLDVSFVELCTRSVDDAVEAFLSSQHANAPGAASSAATLDALAAQIPHTLSPLVARPPCMLRPGAGIFLDGWMRFFSYRSRGDTTIPLVAVDWPTLHERLQ